MAEVPLDAKSKIELKVKLDSIISQMKAEVIKLEESKKLSESLVK